MQPVYQFEITPETVNYYDPLAMFIEINKGARIESVSCKYGEMNDAPYARLSFEDMRIRDQTATGLYDVGRIGFTSDREGLRFLLRNHLHLALLQPKGYLMLSAKREGDKYKILYRGTPYWANRAEDALELIDVLASTVSEYVPMALRWIVYVEYATLPHGLKLIELPS